MIEAVNSTVSNATLVRGVAEQQSVARSFAANPERIQEIPKAPFISPYIRVDTNFDKAVLLIRDSDTGDVIRQFPSESQLEAYRRAQAASQRTQAQVARTEQLTQSAPAPVTIEVERTAAPVVPQVSAESRQVESTPVSAPVAPAPQAQTVNTEA